MFWHILIEYASECVRLLNKFAYRIAYLLRTSVTCPVVSINTFFYIAGPSGIPVLRGKIPPLYRRKLQKFVVRSSEQYQSVCVFEYIGFRFLSELHLPDDVYRPICVHLLIMGNNCIYLFIIKIVHEVQIWHKQ